MDKIIGLVAIVILLALRIFSNGKEIKGFDYDVPCPHGYTDWSDCPDCCH